MQRNRLKCRLVSLMALTYLLFVPLLFYNIGIFRSFNKLAETGLCYVYKSEVNHFQCKQRAYISTCYQAIVYVGLINGSGSVQRESFYEYRQMIKSTTATNSKLLARSSLPMDNTTFSCYYCEIPPEIRLINESDAFYCVLAVICTIIAGIILLVWISIDSFLLTIYCLGQL